MKRTIVILIILFVPLLAFAQHDTVRWTITQYDSVRKFNNLGVYISGDSLHRDTILTVDKKEYTPQEVSDWFLSYMMELGELRTFVISYDSSRICMIFTKDEGKKGNYVEYYCNGNPKVLGQYCLRDGDKKYGPWFYYNKDGSRKRCRMYQGGKYCTD